VSDLLLPTYYTDIQPCILPQKLLQVPNVEMQLSETALARWVTAGPEIIRTLLQFEGQQCSFRSDVKYHKRMPFFQRRFKNDVAQLVEVLTRKPHFLLQIMAISWFFVTTTLQTLL